jgi:hypothetical protein
MRLTVAAALAALLSLASPTFAATPCYDLGHVGNCPAVKPAPDRCTGWRDDRGVCRHGMGGSGMGSRGYVGRCGAGTC